MPQIFMSENTTRRHVPKEINLHTIYLSDERTLTCKDDDDDDDDDV